MYRNPAGLVSYLSHPEALGIYSLITDGPVFARTSSH